MLNGLTKSKFYLKCKPAIKLTKTRIEIISKKRNSIEKYLMGDIADLLKNRLDDKAYERAEGLCAETNLSACYAFVAKYCDFVDDSLSIMDKQRDCPEECKEAVSSLIFAAARFADLPELRDLRTAFIGRYENSLDANCSKEFVEKLKARTPTEDMKLQILKYIALEYSIEWNSKPLERKLLGNPLPYQQDPRKNIMDADKNPDMDEAILARRRKKERVDRVENKRETKDTKPVERRVNHHDEPKLLKPPTSYHRVEDNMKKSNPSADDIELPKPLKPPVRHQRVKDNMRKSNPSADEIGSPKPAHHLRVEDNLRKSNPSADEIESLKPLKPPPSHQKLEDMRKANPSAVEIESTKPLNPLPGHQRMEGMRKANPSAIEIGSSKPLKPPPGRQNMRAVVVKGETSLRNNEEEQIWRKKIKEKEEEENMMDKLLMHYSRKQSPYEQKEVEASLKHHHPMVGSGGRESRRTRNKEGKRERSSSLPPEHMNSERERVKSNGHARNGSLKQEMLSLSPAGNVHPNLPDYEDFIARFAAFKGK